VNGPATIRLPVIDKSASKSHSITALVNRADRS
jgi:hypothetical protein